MIYTHRLYTPRPIQSYKTWLHAYHIFFKPKESLQIRHFHQNHYHHHSRYHHPLLSPLPQAPPPPSSSPPAPSITITTHTSFTKTTPHHHPTNSISPLPQPPHPSPPTPPALLKPPQSPFHKDTEGRLRGLAVACWTTDHYHPCSNLGVGISEGCFIFDFASLPW